MSVMQNHPNVDELVLQMVPKCLIGPLDDPVHLQGIYFKLDPSLLDDIYNAYIEAVKDTPAPTWIPSIEDAAHRFFEMQAPRLVTNVYAHFDVSVSLILDYLMLGTSDIKSINPSRISTRSLRQHTKPNPMLIAGNSNYKVSRALSQVVPHKDC
jgi:hypothetical protein